MTLREEFDKYFEELNIEVILFPNESKIKFNNIDDLKKYIDDEVRFWTSFYNTDKLNHIYSYFTNIMNNITNIFNLFNQSNLDNIKYYMNSVYSQLSQIGYPAIYSKSFLAQELKKIITDEPTYGYEIAIGYFEFVHSKTISSFSYGRLLGYLRGYEVSSLTNNNKDENETLFLKEFHKDLSEKLSETINNFYSYKQNMENTYKNFSSTTEEWIESKKEELTKLVEDKNKLINDLIEQEKKEMESINATFTEHTRIEKPAKYWEELEKKYIEDGEKWMKFSIIVGFITIIFLWFILYNVPESLSGNLDKLTSVSIRSSIVLTLLVSVLVYLLRLFVKLSMSAYHLARDAKERHQLSHIYLALIKESGINENERAIVLQSLFSRADTGLLKGDSTPAFPVEGLLSQIGKNLGK